MTLSIICPIFFSFRGRDILIRAKRILALFADNDQIEVIFVLGLTGEKKLETAFVETVTREGGRCILREYTPGDSPSPGELRHIGTQHAQGDILLFWDIDLVASEQLIHQALAHPFFKEYGFVVIPCLYMNSSYRWSSPAERLPRDLSNLFFNEALYVALNTSTVLISKNVYQKSRGFQKKFSGHGFEDFDFLCDLAQRICGISISDAEFSSYEKNFSPLFYTDFRRHLNKLTLPVFLDGIFSLHIYHPVSKKFLQRRSKNYTMFLDTHLKHSNLSSQIDRNAAIIDNINFFLKEIEKRHLPIDHYKYLFNNIDHSLFLKLPFWKHIYKKIRKCFLMFASKNFGS